MRDGVSPEALGAGEVKVVGGKAIRCGGAAILKKRNTDNSAKNEIQRQDDQFVSPSAALGSTWVGGRNLSSSQAGRQLKQSSTNHSVCFAKKIGREIFKVCIRIGHVSSRGRFDRPSWSGAPTRCHAWKKVRFRSNPTNYNFFLATSQC